MSANGTVAAEDVYRFIGKFEHYVRVVFEGGVPRSGEVGGRIFDHRESFEGVNGVFQTAVCQFDLDVRGEEHTGYFAPLTTFKNVYKYNLALIDRKVADELFDEKWPIYTRTNDSCPTQYFAGSSVKGSVVSNGCLIEGTIENSIVGRGCKIGKGCVIKNCIISSDAVIAEGTHLENLIVDKHASILHAKEIICESDNPGYVKRGDTI